MREPCPAMMFSRLYRPKFLRFSRKAFSVVDDRSGVAYQEYQCLPLRSVDLGGPEPPGDV
jgi:hypothetical protein